VFFEDLRSSYEADRVHLLVETDPAGCAEENCPHRAFVGVLGMKGSAGKVYINRWLQEHGSSLVVIQAAAI
jgi:hypothetical protein